MEARDKIRRQTEENKTLCEALSRVNAQLVAVQVDRSTVSNVDLLRSVENIVRGGTIESEKKIHQFVVYSWDGFLNGNCCCCVHA